MYVALWFFFPRVLLVPVLVLSALAALGGCVSRYRILLDSAAGEVAITAGFWTKHVRLTRIELVDETAGFAPKIKLADGWTYSITPFRKRGVLLRLLKIRTGFEGMERAITGAATAALAAEPLGTSARRPRRRFKALTACVFTAVGLMSLTVAALVRPQTGGGLVRAVADVLKAFYGVAGAVIVAIGVAMLFIRGQ